MSSSLGVRVRQLELGAIAIEAATPVRDLEVTFAQSNVTLSV